MQTELNPVFAGLPDIVEVRRFQEQEDGECFTALQEVFTAHGMCDRFAVTLLHTHFPVYGHEILLDKPDLQNRSILTEVVPPQNTSYLPCSWRLMQTDSAYEFVPNQYIALPVDFDGSGGIVSGSPVGGLHFAQPTRCHPTTLNACYHVVLWCLSTCEMP